MPRCRYRHHFLKLPPASHTNCYMALHNQKTAPFLCPGFSWKPQVLSMGAQTFSTAKQPQLDPAPTLARRNLCSVLQFQHHFSASLSRQITASNRRPWHLPLPALQHLQQVQFLVQCWACLSAVSSFMRGWGHISFAGTPGIPEPACGLEYRKTSKDSLFVFVWGSFFLVCHF